MNNQYIYPDVSFISKHSPGKEPWLNFGSTRMEYERWAPHICGICCIKMIGDTLGLTNNESLHSLTMECFNGKGFILDGRGEIAGAFHHPLLRLLTSRGLNGEVLGNIEIDTILRAIDLGDYVILSVDLVKINSSLNGSHLVLIYGYDDNLKEFILHDCSNVISSNGRGVKLKINELDRISNGKGLVIYKSQYPRKLFSVKPDAEDNLSL